MAPRSRLAAVLRVRKLQEDLARQNLAFANMALAAARQDLDNRVDHYRSMAPGAGLFSFEDFLREEQELRFAADSVGFGEVQVRRAGENADEMRDEYLVARKKVRVIEKLEARRRAEEDLLGSRRAAKAVDDLVTTRWASGMAGSRPSEASTGTAAALVAGAGAR